MFLSMLIRVERRDRKVTSINPGRSVTVFFHEQTPREKELYSLILLCLSSFESAGIYMVQPQYRWSWKQVNDEVGIALRANLVVVDEKSQRDTFYCFTLNLRVKNATKTVLVPKSFNIICITIFSHFMHYR